MFYTLAFNINNGLFSSFGTSSEAGTAALIAAAAIFCFAISYILGSLNAAIIVSRLVYHDDVRKHGSKNAGMTNMLRTYGKRAALLTLIGDLSKTALAILITSVFFGFNYIEGVSTGAGFLYVSGLFAVIGHIFPIFYKFKGGKGVLATATMALILSPIPFLFLLLLFIVIVAASKYVSLGSVTVAVLYPVLLNAYFKVSFGGMTTPGLASLSTIAIAILIVWCHRENLKRISDRTERKISFKSKKDRDLK